MKYRFENFGGIIASEDPPFLAYVDRDFMRGIGLEESPSWKEGNEEVGLLSAPTEVHLAATNRCPLGCEHCYMSSDRPEPGEMDTETFKGALRALADMGVFHVALGGGEALTRPDLFELAHYARSLGIVPNLTVSGAIMSAEIAERMNVFGQVNVSLDGVGALYGVHRGVAGFEKASRAIDLLRAASVATGINCVVGRNNFDGIPQLFDLAAEKGVNEIEFLRYKPAGRGAASYLTHRTTYEQNVRLVPLLMEQSERTGVVAKIDCSFMPMLAIHGPPPEVLQRMATYGCEAGNVLLGIRSDGMVSGCSFLSSEGLGISSLSKEWLSDPHLVKMRTFVEKAPEPCRSCDYLSICKGGCHAVALHLVGDPHAPDPDCPRVVRYQRGEVSA